MPSIEEIKEEAQKLQEELVAWRRHLHQYPEVGLDVPRLCPILPVKTKGWMAPYGKLTFVEHFIRRRPSTDGKDTKKPGIAQVQFQC